MSFETRLRAGLDRAAEPLDPDVERSLRWVLVRRQRRVVVRRGALVLATAAAAIVSVLGIRVAVTPQPDEASSGGAQVVGSYEVTLTARDSSGVSPSVAGEWRMRLRADGVVVLTAPDSFQAERNPAGISYDATDTTFTTNAFVNDFCNSVGTYTWRLNGDELVFEATDDRCPIRRVLLATTPWTRSS